MILLDEKELLKGICRYCPDTTREDYECEECKELLNRVVKETGKKILIELQAIYNIPDLRQSDKRMGEFIQSLMEEAG